MLRGRTQLGGSWKAGQERGKVYQQLATQESFQPVQFPAIVVLSTKSTIMHIRIFSRVMNYASICYCYANKTTIINTRLINNKSKHLLIIWNQGKWLLIGSQFCRRNYHMLAKPSIQNCCACSSRKRLSYEHGCSHGLCLKREWKGDLPTKITPTKLTWGEESQTSTCLNRKQDSSHLKIKWWWPILCRAPFGLLAPFSRYCNWGTVISHLPKVTQQVSLTLGPVFFIMTLQLPHLILPWKE